MKQGELFGIRGKLKLHEMALSVSYSQQDILKWILVLYNNGNPIEVDLTYGKGNMWKGIPGPRKRYDLAPQLPDVMMADCRKHPSRCSEIGSIMFDPPFLFGGGNNGIMNNTYGCFPNRKEFEAFLNDSLQEISRILKSGGLLIFKCQDIISGKQNFFIHVLISTLAESHRLRPEDLFININTSALINWNIKRQHHARKLHSYFWVFKKRFR